MDIPPPSPAGHLNRQPSSISSTPSTGAAALPHPTPSHRPPSFSLPRPEATTDPDLPTRFRRGSTASTSTGLAGLSRDEIEERERLVNDYEAEEERLVNVLGRRMEEMRGETTSMHNMMEGESEALVNKLQRQIQSLQAQLALQSPSSPNLPTTASSNNGGGGGGGAGGSPRVQVQQQQLAPLPAHGLPPIGSPVLPAASLATLLQGGDPLNPSQEKVFEVLRKENDGLRARLSDAERGFIHVCRQNDVYRDELITLRQRLNLPYQDLCLPSVANPSNTTHLSSGPRHPGRQQSSSGRSDHSVPNRQFRPGTGHRAGSSSSSARIAGPELSSSSVSSSALDLSSSGGSNSTPTSPLPSPGLPTTTTTTTTTTTNPFAPSPEVERRLSMSTAGADRPTFRVAERGQLRRVGSGSADASAGGSQ